MKYSVIFRNTSKRGESFGIRGIGSKIKGVFKSTTMEGALLPSSAMNDVDDEMVSAAAFKYRSMVFPHRCSMS